MRIKDELEYTIPYQWTILTNPLHALMIEVFMTIFLEARVPFCLGMQQLAEPTTVVGENIAECNISNVRAVRAAVKNVCRFYRKIYTFSRSGKNEIKGIKTCRNQTKSNSSKSQMKTEHRTRCLRKVDAGSDQWYCRQLQIRLYMSVILNDVSWYTGKR